MNTEKKTKSRRIIELDLLRGYFIVVIILDHLEFWPSPFALITGEGRLWVSAAEGFFIISGLLVGYIRGCRGATTPLKVLTSKLVRRALLLYVWGSIISLLVIAFTKYVAPNNPLLPSLPDEQYLTSWSSLVFGILTLGAFSDWIYFLRLYAVMLLVTPLFLLLLRRGVPYWAVGLISVGLYALSFLREMPDAELQWQLLFFIPALIGYKLENILDWLSAHQKARAVIMRSLIAFTLVTVTMSALVVHGSQIAQALNLTDLHATLQATINPFFSNNPMEPGRMILSFIWFGGFLALFRVLRPWLTKWAKWLLLPFGQRSLTGYCLHALVLPPIVVLLSPWNYLTNTLISIAVVLLMWVLIKTPLVQKILPQ